MKLSTLSILCAASLLLLSGCVSSSPKPQEKALIDSSLPLVTLTKNGIIRDMKTVAFEWKSIQDPRVNAVYIYKRDFSDKENKQVHYFATINNRFQTHFVDTSVEPDRRYSYAFQVASKDAEGARSKIFVVNTLPVLQSVTWIHSIQGLPRMAKIIWRPHQSERVEKYIVERKTYGDEKWHEIATLEGRLNAEYIDMDLNDDHVYLYRVRVETYDGIISTPSEIVKVVTKALPKSITQINVTKNLPRKIDITWEESDAKDFARYYLYRSDRSDGNYELIAKLYNNKFEDKIDKDGKSYFYRVSVVDKDGLQSENEKHTVMGMTLSKPLAPAAVEAMHFNGKVVLRWNINDARAKYYKVVRKQKDGWFKESIKKYDHIDTNKFTDSEIKPESTYTYFVYAVDVNGLVSKPSMEVKIITDGSKVTQSKTQNKTKSEQKVAPKVAPKSTQTQETISPVQDLDLNEI